MSIPRLSLVLSLIIILGLLAMSLPASAQEPPKHPPFKEGEILVKFRPGTPGASMQAAMSAQGAEALDEIPQIGVKRISVPAGKELAVVEALSHNPNVEFAEPNYLAFAILTPNDPYYGSQWALPKIQAPQAWDITTGSSSITIAIVDTGVDLDHPDLDGKLVPGITYVPLTPSPQDDNGHGTHVAGIAAAETNNSTGVAGISWGAKIMPVKVLDAYGSGNYSWVASGMTWATDNGAKIINLSLAGPWPSSTLENAVNYAHSHGVLVVAAAGNCAAYDPNPPCYADTLGPNPDMYPAFYTNTVAVAATTSSDGWATFSEHRPYVDVSAPGVNIRSTYLYPPYYYAYMGGTSMAAPHVSGLAALVWSMNPSLTPDQVRGTIEATADDLTTPPGGPGWDEYFGHGRINAYQAVLAAAPPTLTVSTDKLIFLADESVILPSPSQVFQVGNAALYGSLDWSASESASWLDISPTSGTASYSGPADISASVTLPGSNGLYTTQITVTSSTAYVQGSPQTVDVVLSYVDTLYKTNLPLAVKSYGP